jgi:hypothetical protein
MVPALLSDLDELLQTVRDRNSREYIAEAIAAYRARAYRSAIMGTWVAVAYDIISKVRELFVQGDGAAKASEAALDAAIALKETDYGVAAQKLQVFENGLLDQALKSFEFLSPQEHRDLERLKQDRNLCAHPAFTTEATLFQPTAELVRTHITHAILHLLQHPPVQGRNALKRMKNDIIQPSFPSDQKSVSEFLEARYFDHAKRALLETLVVVFLKTLIKQAESDLIGKEMSVLRCLVALLIRHPLIFERKMNEQLPHLTDGSDDAELKRVFLLFRADKRCWAWLSRPTKIKVVELVKKYEYNAQDIDLVMCCLEIDELRPIVLERVKTYSDDQKEEMFAQHQRPEFIDEAIEIYSEVGNFRRSDKISMSIILPFSTMFNAEHIRRVLKAAASNIDIHQASGSPGFFKEMFERTSDLHEETKAAWQEFMSEMQKGKKPDDYYTYPTLRAAMEQVGMWPAAPSPGG